MDHNVSFPDAEKIKVHFRKNQVAYSFAAGIVAFGVVGVATKGRLGVTISNPIDSDTIIVRPIAFFSKQIVTVIVANRQGPPSWVVECLNDGMRQNSQRAMAMAKGISASELSAHLNGRLDDVQGLHFKRIALAA